MASIPQTHMVTRALFSEIGRAQRMLISSRNRRIRAERATRKIARLNQTIVKNMGLVYQVAHRTQRMGTPFEDLVQEGAMWGLRRAIQKYDPKRAKLSTYAMRWIWQAMSRARTVQGPNIPIPIHTREDASRLSRLAARMWNELKREPTPEELSQRSGLPVEKIKLLLNLPKANPTLNEPARREDEEETRLDRVADEASPNAEDENIFHDQLDMVKGALLQLVAKGKISVRDLKMFIELFDLEHKRFPGKPTTCVEVGKMFDLTRERTRQIRNQVLERIRQYLVARNTFT